MNSITASAPGKILLLGGYSVLAKGNIAYSITVDVFVHARIKKRKDNRIIVNSPQLKIRLETTLDYIERLKIDDKNKFMLETIKIIIKYLKQRGMELSGFELTTTSDKAFSVRKGKSGLGSSAAVTVATTAAIFEIIGLKAKENIEQIHKVAQLAHAIAQKKIGSGFDVASACHGSILYSRFDLELLNLDKIDQTLAKNLDCIVENMPFPKNV